MVKLNVFERIGLAFGGVKYYQTKLLARSLLRRYRFQESYAAKQIQYAADELGYPDNFDPLMAGALFGQPGDSVPLDERFRIRSRLGLVGEGAHEVFRVYLGIEKQFSDPFGSDHAQETTGGLS